jgi:hypothetical protein
MPLVPRSFSPHRQQLLDEPPVEIDKQRENSSSTASKHIFCPYKRNEAFDSARIAGELFDPDENHYELQ